MKKPRQLIRAAFFLSLEKENIKRKRMLIRLKTKAKPVLNPVLSQHFFPVCSKDNK